MALNRDEMAALFADRLVPAVLGMGRAAGAQLADTEDAIQEAALDLWERMQRGQQIDLPENYALRTASHGLKRVFDRRRRWDTIRRRLRAEVVEPDPTLLADGELGPLAVAFSKLGYEDRQLLWLSDVRESPDSEAGAIIDLKPEAVRQRLVRARVRLAALYIKELLGDREILPACRRPLSLFPRWWADTITPAQTKELGRHLVACRSCQETKRLLKDHRKRVGVRLLFPPMTPPSKERREHLVADVEQLLASPRRPKGRRWRRWQLAPLLALLLVPAVTLPALARLPLGPVHNVSATSCPAPPTGGYAYLDRDEVFYRSSIGAPARQVTSTGGHTDDFWWMPDGKRLLYKVSSSPPDIAGDVHMIDLASGAQLWNLGGSAQFFALSPDGSSWAAGSIAVVAGNDTGMSVMVGQFPQTAAHPSSSFKSQIIGVSPLLYRADYYQDRGAVPVSALGASALNWLARGLFISDQGDGIYSPSGAFLGSYQLTTQLYGDFMGVGPRSQFALDHGRLLTYTCAGKSSLLNDATLGGGPTWISVASDGRTALMTAVESRPAVDVFRLYADGDVKRLSTDGVTGPAKFQT